MKKLLMSFILLSVGFMISGCHQTTMLIDSVEHVPAHQLYQPKKDVVGRPVRIVTFSFPDDGSKNLADIEPLVLAEAQQGTDLIVLPEAFLGNEKTQTVEGPAITAMAKISDQYNTYIIVPIDRFDENGIRKNSAVIINRHGKVAGIYNKVYDLYALPNLYEIDVPGINGIDTAPRPGENARVFETDFGKIAIGICFDVNFPELWQMYENLGAEMVIWPSAYSSGTCLQAHAINHHYYVISATGYSRHCQVFDITGERILNERAKDINISRLTLDMDRGIYHNNWNLGPDKLDKLLADHGDKIEVEKRLPDEEWFVLRATQPGISARQLAAEYGLEELREYIARARRLNYEFRGSKDFDYQLINAR